MLKGRYTCEQLKAVRTEIAKANEIDYTPAVCHFQGICRGTCPVCEAERSYIERELSLRQKAGKAVKIVGLAASMLALSAQPVVAQERQEMCSDSLVWEAYFFDFGQVKSENLRQVEEMAEFVAEYPDRLYLVVGHTDERGSIKYNLKLSYARAKYIVQQIKDSCPNSSVMIVPVGLGFYQPHIKNASNEVEHEQNRRASLEIYNPKRFKGRSAALVEFAIYKALKHADDSKIEQFEKELNHLNEQIYTPKVVKKYEKLAKQIRKSRGLGGLDLG